MMATQHTMENHSISRRAVQMEREEESKRLEHEFVAATSGLPDLSLESNFKAKVRAMDVDMLIEKWPNFREAHMRRLRYELQEEQDRLKQDWQQDAAAAFLTSTSVETTHIDRLDLAGKTAVSGAGLITTAAAAAAEKKSSSSSNDSSNNNNDDNRQCQVLVQDWRMLMRR